MYLLVMDGKYVKWVLSPSHCENSSSTFQVLSLAHSCRYCDAYRTLHSKLESVALDEWYTSVEQPLSRSLTAPFTAPMPPCCRCWKAGASAGSSGDGHAFCYPKPRRRQVNLTSVTRCVFEFKAPIPLAVNLSFLVFPTTETSLLCVARLRRFGVL